MPAEEASAQALLRPPGEEATPAQVKDGVILAGLDGDVHAVLRALGVLPGGERLRWTTHALPVVSTSY